MSYRPDQQTSAARTTFYTYADDAYNDKAITLSETFRGEQSSATGIKDSVSDYTGI